MEGKCSRQEDQKCVFGPGHAGRRAKTRCAGRQKVNEDSIIKGCSGLSL